MFKSSAAKLSFLASVIAVVGIIFTAGIKSVYFGQQIDATFENSRLGKEASSAVKILEKDVKVIEETQDDIEIRVRDLEETITKHSEQFEAFRSYLAFCLSDNEAQQRCEKFLRD